MCRKISNGCSSKTFMCVRSDSPDEEMNPRMSLLTSPRHQLATYTIKKQQQGQRKSIGLQPQSYEPWLPFDSCTCLHDECQK